MPDAILTAETGRQTGTGPSRRSRAEGRVPGVLYGGGKPADTVSFDRGELRRALNTEAGRNALVQIQMDGETFITLVREIQRHPIRRDVTHIDFLKVDPTKPVEVDVPIRLVGEPKQVTVMGGMIEQRLNELHVRVRPDAIPDWIDLDVSEMQLDHALHVKDLVLPEGTVSLIADEEPVVTAELTRAAVTSSGGEDEEEAAAEEAAPEGE